MKGKIRRLESKLTMVAGGGTSGQIKRKLQETVLEEEGQGLAQGQGQGLEHGEEGRMIITDDQGPAGVESEVALPTSSTSSTSSQDLLRMQVLHDNLSHLYDLLQRYG